MAQGWSRGAPHDEVELLPLSDGGPGLPRRALPGPRAARPSRPRSATRSAARCPRRCSWSSATAGARPTSRRRRRAACTCSTPTSATPGLTSTWGVGQLLEVGVEQGATKVVVGVGGSATNDAGAGMLAALGAGPASVLARGGPRPRLGARRRAARPGRRRRAPCRGPRSCSRPTTTPRCSACRAPARSRRRARAPRPSWPRRSRARWAGSPTSWAASLPSAAGRAAQRDAAPPRPRGRRRCRRWAGLRPARAGCSAGGRRRRGAARAARSGSRRPAATSSSPAPAGSTGARCAGPSSPGSRPPPSRPGARPCSSRGSASSAGARR